MGFLIFIGGERSIRVRFLVFILIFVITFILVVLFYYLSKVMCLGLVGFFLEVVDVVFCVWSLY